MEIAKCLSDLLLVYRPRGTSFSDFLEYWVFEGLDNGGVEDASLLVLPVDVLGSDLKSRWCSHTLRVLANGDGDNT